MANTNQVHAAAKRIADPFKVPYLVGWGGALIIVVAIAIMWLLATNGYHYAMMGAAATSAALFAFVWFAPTRTVYGIGAFSAFRFAMGYGLDAALPQGVIDHARTGGMIMTLFFVTTAILLIFDFSENGAGFWAFMFVIAGMVVIGLVRQAKSGGFTTFLLMASLPVGLFLLVMGWQIPVPGERESGTTSTEGMEEVVTEMAEVTTSQACDFDQIITPAAYDTFTVYPGQRILITGFNSMYDTVDASSSWATVLGPAEMSVECGGVVRTARSTFRATGGEEFIFANVPNNMRWDNQSDDWKYERIREARARHNAQAALSGS